ncbi:hypothetical protein VPH35_042335 [Triticum aestivum]
MRLDPLLTATPALARVSAVGSGTGGQVVLLWYSSLPTCREEQAAYELHRDATDGDVNGRDVPRRRRACTEAGSGKGIHRQANSMVRCWRWKTWPTWRCMSSRTRLGSSQTVQSQD